MKTTLIALAASAMTLAASAAIAQSTGKDPAVGQQIELPKACQNGAQAGSAQTMAMQGHDVQGMMSSMDEAHKGYMQAMINMNPPMMQGMMNKDTDTAFVCSMLAHHLGAIEMAKVELRHGDDSDAKRMAEKSMKEQEREVVEMKAWIDKHAK